VDLAELRLTFMTWDTQWSRVQRHYVRLLRAISDRPSPDGWDDVTNFFVHSLRFWTGSCRTASSPAVSATPGSPVIPSRCVAILRTVPSIVTLIDQACEAES
jgi:hypothetical protein